jgi:hypothetical protein
MNIHNQEKMDEFDPPTKFKQKIKILHSQLPAILADFEKYYVFYNKNPEYQEYQQMFQNIKANLSTINSDLFIISTNIQKNTDSINKKMLELDMLIKKEKDKNKKLKNKLGMVEDKNNASFELISDYNDMYGSGYLHNWSIFISICIVLSTFKKVEQNI